MGFSDLLLGYMSSDTIYPERLGWGAYGGGGCPSQTLISAEVRMLWMLTLELKGWHGQGRLHHINRIWCGHMTCPQSSVRADSFMCVNNQHNVWTRVDSFYGNTAGEMGHDPSASTNHQPPTGKLWCLSLAGGAWLSQSLIRG